MQKVPDHLQPDTARWYAQVIADYELEPHHLRLLQLAAESFDRACEARKILDRDGLTFIDRFGSPHARPEVAIERDSRIAFSRLLRELALDIEAPADNRPPSIRKGAACRA